MTENIHTPEVTHIPDLREAMHDVAEKGVASIPGFLRQQDIDAILHTLPSNAFQEIDTLYENGVRESHSRYTLHVQNETVDRVVAAIRAAVRRTASDFPSMASWSPNDIAFQLYGDTSGISAHRDHSRYMGIIIAVTLQGSAAFTVHEERTSPPLETFYTMPGDAILLRSSQLNPEITGHPGLFHAVGPALGNQPRISMGLRDDSGQWR